MRITPTHTMTIAAFAALLGACDIGGSASGDPLADGASGVYTGTYEVPVPPELAAAAVYDVAEIHWSVDGGVGRLTYDLPLGLVGKSIGLSFEGPVDASASSFTLTGSAGTADCAVDGATLVCHETMAGLTPLSPDYDVVTQLASTQYAGPPADRVDVAQRFAGDPIGIVRIDLTANAASGRDQNQR